MAMTETTSSSISSAAAATTFDTKSGYDAESSTFRSLRPHVPFPPENLPLSFTSFVFSNLPSPLPSNPAIINSSTGESISYARLLSSVRSLSSFLRSSVYNLSRGDTAFVLSPSSPTIPILYLSLFSLGVTVCPSNPISTPEEISRQLALVSPVAIIFATSSTLPKLPKPRPNCMIVLIDSAEFRELLISRVRDDDSTLLVRQSDVAAIQFSSGTTGRSKAVAITHRNFIAMMAGYPPEEEEVVVGLLTAPMFHSFGFFFCLKGIANGETVVVVDKPGMTQLLKSAQRYGATMVLTAPPAVVAMARGKEVEEYDLGRMRTLLTGGAPLSEAVAVEFMKRFPGVRLWQGYGSTETGGISRMVEDEFSRITSVGRLTVHVEARVVDIATGKPMSVGQQGELWVRGPAIMKGYVGDEQANAATFDKEGWLKTGDICYFDDDGFLYVVDRLKELIKYKAYQVPPAELEHLLHSIPDIVDAGVIPYPQEEVGQIPMAFVVRKPGSNLSEEQVMDYVSKRVAPYKKIRKVAFVNAIPKSAAGKILRRELISQVLCRSKF